MTPTDAETQEVSAALALDGGGDGLYIAFAEPTIRFRSAGSLQPLVSLGAYYMYTDEDDAWGLAPTIGIRYSGPSGLFMTKFGWGRTGTSVVPGGGPPPMMMALTPSATVVPVGPALSAADTRDETAEDGMAENQSGLTALLHGEFWGDGLWNSQGIFSYSLGTDVLWARARITRRATEPLFGPALALGAEVVWQLETVADGAGDRYEAIQVGPVLQLIRESATAIGVSGGFKQLRATGEETWYGKLEFAIDL
jgi:hypothetical protein